jgi:hypothetical protein
MDLVVRAVATSHALAICKAHFGTDHLRTAACLHSLGRVLRAQGELDGARALHERARAIFEARLGADHPDTARNQVGDGLVVAEVWPKPGW